MASQVSIVRCASYEQAAVTQAVRDAVEKLGGLRTFVKPGQNVLIKPNLLSAKPPERAVTTHPTVVRAVIELVREAGATPRVGDSPSTAYKGIQNLWDVTGMAAVCRETGTELLSFEAAGVVKVGEFYVAKPIAEADVILSLPKLKTHTLTVITCAIKNMFGVLPGMRKAEYHRNFTRPKTFVPILVQLLASVRPRLSILDAVVGMEGDGPAVGTPKPIGAIMASEDPVAMDAACAALVGLEPRKVPLIRQAAERGLGEADLSRVEILGEAIASVKPAEFKLARTTAVRFVPEFMLSMARPLVWIRPTFGPTCEGCGQCVKKCPVQALTLVDKRPVLDEDKCIECLCCHELCPRDAVDVRLSWLARMLTV